MEEQVVKAVHVLKFDRNSSIEKIELNTKVPHHGQIGKFGRDRSREIVLRELHCLQVCKLSEIRGKGARQAVVTQIEGLQENEVSELTGDRVA